MSIYNRGNIIGVGGTGISEHAAFAFNNFDGSNDTTRVLLSNEGNIKLNAPTSAGMMLRPEINDGINRGLNMQMGQNIKDITLNGRGSAGITVVKNPNNGGYNKTNYSVSVPIGGLLASRSDEANKSGILHAAGATINIQSDDSVGVSILNTIQDVRVNGKIDIGTVDPSTLSGDGADKSLANSGTGALNKVEGAVGVYTEVATRPVRGRTYAYDPVDILMIMLVKILLV